MQKIITASPGTFLALCHLEPVERMILGYSQGDRFIFSHPYVLKQPCQSERCFLESAFSFLGIISSFPQNGELHSVDPEDHKGLRV